MGDNESGNLGHEADGDHSPEVGADHEQHDEWTASDDVDFGADDIVSSNDLGNIDGMDHIEDVDDVHDVGDLHGERPESFAVADDYEPEFGDELDAVGADMHIEPDTVGLFSPHLLDAVLEQIPGVEAESFTDRLSEFVDDGDFGLGLDTRAVTRLLDTGGVEAIIEYGTTDHIVQRVESGQIVLVGGTDHHWSVTYIDGDVLELRDEAGGSRRIGREAFDELWNQSTTEIVEIRPNANAVGPIRFDDDMRIAVLPMTIND